MKYLIVIFFCISFMIVNAQTQNAWFTNQTDAKDYAVNHDDNILMVFAGGDWCRPCIKFKKDILESDEFKAFANENIVVLYLDFPSKRKNKLSKEARTHNEELAEKYNKSGIFPTIILMDKDMNKIKDLTYEGQRSEQFINLIK